MQKMLDFIKNNKFESIALLLWLIIVSIVGFNHEFFRDEVFPFYELRKENFVFIIQSIIDQGHTFLWHFIQLPFAKLNFPISSIQFLPIISMLVGLAYFLYKSPFNKWTKLAVMFSMPFLYYFPVIVRPYALIPICLFLLAQFYPKRDNHPYLYTGLIILLSQTHPLMAGSICLGLTFFFMYENINKTIKEKSINVLYPSIILFVYYIIFTLIYYLNLTSLWEYKYLATFNLLENANEYIPFFISLMKRLGILGIFKEITFIGLLLSVFIYLFTKNKKLFFVCSYSICFLFVVFNKIFQGGILQQKFSLIFLIILFGYWGIKEIEKKGHILITAFFVISLIYQIPNYSILIEDINKNFSDSKAICKFLKQNNYNKISILREDTGDMLPLFEYCRNCNFVINDKIEPINKDSTILVISQKRLVKTNIPENYSLILNNKKHSWKNEILKASPSKVDKLMVYKINPIEE